MFVEIFFKNLSDAGSTPAISTKIINFEKLRKARKKPAQKKSIDYYRVNERINVPEVKVIDEEGNQLGTMLTQKAVSLARERGFDLVEVSPKAAPPIAKFLNYGQFKYQKEKELQKQKVQQKKVEIKGIRLSFRISEHDRLFRLEQAKKFLSQGHKLKVELFLRGRERQYMDKAKEILDQFILSLKEIGVKIEQPLEKQRDRLTITLKNG